MGIIARSAHVSTGQIWMAARTGSRARIVDDRVFALAPPDLARRSKKSDLRETRVHDRIDGWQRERRLALTLRGRALFWRVMKGREDLRR
jgi:hypothetical protein